VPYNYECNNAMNYNETCPPSTPSYCDTENYQSQNPKSFFFFFFSFSGLSGVPLDVPIVEFDICEGVGECEREGT
jgi:hypothetical protein